MSIVESKTVASDFDNPNWALKRAFFDGRKAALEDIIKLLTIEE